jgi:alkylation response protein AidB-like acyl-CoA dehydrogenase
VRTDTGEPLAVVVDPARHGVVIDGDVDPFGQRLAAGGSVEFDAVPVSADDVLGSLSADEDALSPLASLASPVGRLVSVQLRLGMAEGVLAEAREYSRAGHSPWDPAWPAGSPQDPQVLTTYGELTVLARSASALTDQALEALQGGLARGEDLTYDEYAEISVLVAMAEAAASRAVQECTARALDVIGAAPRPHGWASTASGATPGPTPCTSPWPTDSAMSGTTSSTVHTPRSSCPPDLAGPGLVLRRPMNPLTTGAAERVPAIPPMADADRIRTG